MSDDLSLYLQVKSINQSTGERSCTDMVTKVYYEGLENGNGRFKSVGLLVALIEKVSEVYYLEGNQKSSAGIQYDIKSIK